MVKAIVNNLPESIKPGYIIARADDIGKLWYYDTYPTLEQAESVVVEIGGGAILVLEEDDQCKGCKYIATMERGKEYCILNECAFMR